MPSSKLYECKSCSVTTPFFVFLLKKSKNQFHHVSLSVLQILQDDKITSLDKRYQKLQEAKSTHQTSFLSVLLPLRSIQWSLFHFVQQCFCESHLISQTCYRPKQETSSHDTARFKWVVLKRSFISQRRKELLTPPLTHHFRGHSASLRVEISVFCLRASLRWLTHLRFLLTHTWRAVYSVAQVDFIWNSLVIRLRGHVPSRTKRYLDKHFSI